MVEEYFDCLGISNLYDYIIDELEETCDDGTTPAVTVCAIFTVTAILVAIAAALN